MDKIYFNQISVTQPMAEGVAEAMASWEAMDSEKLVQETREQISTLFRGPGAEKVVFTETVGTAMAQTIRGLFKEGDHVLVSSLENDEVIGALEAIGHETGSDGRGGFLFHIILFHFAHPLQAVRSHFICILFFLKMLCDCIHIVKLDMSHIIFFFGKFLDLLISIHDHSKCWCLYSYNFQILVIQNGKKTARIDSHQPVCLCPAKC